MDRNTKIEEKPPQSIRTEFSINIRAQSYPKPSLAFPTLQGNDISLKGLKDMFRNRGAHVVLL